MLRPWVWPPILPLRLCDRFASHGTGTAIVVNSTIQRGIWLSTTAGVAIALYGVASALTPYDPDAPPKEPIEHVVSARWLGLLAVAHMLLLGQLAIWRTMREDRIGRFMAETFNASAVESPRSSIGGEAPTSLNRPQ